MRTTAVVIMCAIFSGLNAHAQSVTTMQTMVQPTIMAPDGNIKGCGVRIIGATSAPTETGSLELLDVYVSIYANLFTTVKAGLLTRNANRPSEKPRRTGARIEWLRIGQSKPLKAAVTPSDDVGFFTYGVSAEDGQRTINGILEGKTVWVEYKTPEGHKRIFSGPATVTPDTTKQVLDCLQELPEPIATK